MALWLDRQALVLASESNVRRALLENAGIPLEIRPARIDERAVEGQAQTQDAGIVAAVLARAKAQAVAGAAPGRLVLGADQTLDMGGRRLSKPRDIAAAREQLTLLRGRTHELHAAVALAQDGAIVFEHCAVARLTMRAFSDRFLEDYLAAAGNAVTASVGAYQVEALGIQLFDRIEGDQFTIMGLPLLPLLDYLRGARHLSD